MLLSLSFGHQQRNRHVKSRLRKQNREWFIQGRHVLLYGFYCVHSLIVLLHRLLFKSKYINKFNIVIDLIVENTHMCTWCLCDFCNFGILIHFEQMHTTNSVPRAHRAKQRINENYSNRITWLWRLPIK